MIECPRFGLAFATLNAQESNQLFYSKFTERNACSEHEYSSLNSFTVVLGLRDSHARTTSIPQLFYRDNRVSPRVTSQFQTTTNSFTGVGKRRYKTNPQIFYRGSDKHFKAVKANFLPTLLQEHTTRQTGPQGRKPGTFQLFCRNFNGVHIPAPNITNLRQLKKITQELAIEFSAYAEFSVRVVNYFTIP